MKIKTEEDNVTAGLTLEEIALSGDELPTTETVPSERHDEDLRNDPLPILIAKPIENAQEISAKLDAAEDELTDKFNDGDITAREYRNGLSQVSAQRDEIRWSQRKVDLAYEMRETAEKMAWQREVEDFMTKGPGSHLSQSNAAMVAFDDVVKKVTADPANERLSDRAQLNLALKIYKQEMARAGIGRSDDIDTAKALGDMGGGRSGADFGSIDTMIAKGDLSGVERALSRMSKDERDRYGY